MDEIDQTAEQLIFGPALRGHLHLRREQDGEDCYLTIWKQRGKDVHREIRFKLEGNTLTHVPHDDANG